MINLFGTWDGSFEYLPHLMKALVDASPDTVVKWDTKEIDGEYIQVNHVFWVFVECIHAFNHCRPIFSIDGTHKYGKYDGKLLVACSLDANNGVLPVAFALVESENTSNWSWFMRCICEGVTSREGQTRRNNGCYERTRMVASYGLPSYLRSPLPEQLQHEGQRLFFEEKTWQGCICQERVQVCS
ncbi:hypothetical protein QQ045_011790 [Rhodiola kirilowii]